MQNGNRLPLRLDRAHTRSPQQWLQRTGNASVGISRMFLARGRGIFPLRLGRHDRSALDVHCRGLVLYDCAAGFGDEYSHGLCDGVL